MIYMNPNRRVSRGTQVHTSFARIAFQIGHFRRKYQSDRVRRKTKEASGREA